MWTVNRLIQDLNFISEDDNHHTTNTSLHYINQVSKVWIYPSFHQVRSGTSSLCYIVIYSIMQHHNDTTIIKLTHDDKDAVTNDARRKTQEDFFNKIFTSHFICKVSKRVTQSLRVRGSWRPNITEIFWPQSYGRQRCVFLVLHGCSTGALESTVLGAGFPHYISSIFPLQLYCLPSFSPVWILFNSSALYYLQTPTRWYGHASTISSDI